MQLVAPRAVRRARINRALGLALRKRFCRTLRLRAAGGRHRRRRRPLARAAALLPARRRLRDARLGAASRRCSPRPCSRRRCSPPAGAGTRRARWRSCACGRAEGAAAHPAHAGRRPARRGLPGAVACQDNADPRRADRAPRSPAGRARRSPTACTRPWTSTGLDAAPRGGSRPARSRLVARDTAEPSPFAHEILNANPYAFLDDAPLEERRARAVALRRTLPAADAAGIGALDPDGDRARWPSRRGPTRATPTSCTTLLLDAGIPARDARASPGRAFLEALVAAGRAARRAARRARGLGGGGAARRLAGAGRRARHRGLAARSRRCRPCPASDVPAVARRGRGAGAARLDGAARAGHGAGALARGSGSRCRSSWPRCTGSSRRGSCCAAVPARRRAGTPTGATGACSPASTGSRWGGCGARSSRSRAPTWCASCSAGSTSRRARGSTARAASPRSSGSSQGFHAAAGAWEREILPGARRRLRARAARRALPLRRGGLGPARGRRRAGRRAAAPRRAHPPRAGDAGAARRPALAARGAARASRRRSAPRPGRSSTCSGAAAPASCPTSPP